MGGGGGSRNTRSAPSPTTPSEYRGQASKGALVASRLFSPVSVVAAVFLTAPPRSVIDHHHATNQDGHARCYSTGSAEMPDFFWYSCDRSALLAFTPRPSPKMNRISPNESDVQHKIYSRTGRGNLGKLRRNHCTGGVFFFFRESLPNRISPITQ